MLWKRSKDSRKNSSRVEFWGFRAWVFETQLFVSPLSHKTLCFVFFFTSFGLLFVFFCFHRFTVEAPKLKDSARIRPLEEAVDQASALGVAASGHFRIEAAEAAPRRPPQTLF
ncbi:hypothetical protein Ddye_012939 [Dipteronia dyeriana]|uniref:Transmembrane protein n=1 Tax=Dipteronia dyeriana TaxID=168575 RepID=A0AAE0CJQ3_9ROSI|nr:hypothetical protein Ddye_012939 [Dipteronia dyeriana]